MTLRTAAVGLVVSTACAFAQAHFDVASIKSSKLIEGRNRDNIIANPGSLAMHNVSLKSALQWAYDVKEYQVAGPAWIGDERYDISAKAVQPVEEEQLRKMLQNLLADRFKVTLHREKKDLPYYALLVSKTGPKLTRGNPEGKSVLQPKGFSLTAQDTSLSEAADLLTMIASRINLPPVIDMTGLKGRYNFTIDGSDFIQSVGAGNVVPDPSVIVTAVVEVLQEQLGLKAELRKRPTDVLIIDRAEKLPTEN